jgi:hypothetical protein
MNESDVIKRFLEIGKSISDKESKTKYSADPSELLKDLEQLKKERDIVSAQLRICKDRNITVNKLENVKSMLIRLYDRFSKKYPLNFSRDQGMIVHGFIMLKIAEDISYALDHEISSPQEYYFEPGGDFDCSEIAQILKESINYLNGNKIENYPDLFNFVRSTQKQIVTLDKDCGQVNI